MTSQLTLIQHANESLLVWQLGLSSVVCSFFPSFMSRFLAVCLIHAYITYYIRCTGTSNGISAYDDNSAHFDSTWLQITVSLIVGPYFRSLLLVRFYVMLT